jgi:hypothetical protein
MAYVIQFDVSSTDIEAMFDDNLHVISIPTDSHRSKDSQLAELFDLIQEKLDTREATGFRARMPEAFEPVVQETLEATTQAADASALFTGSSNLCFVIMPFTVELNDVYQNLIRPVAEQFGLTVRRADEIFAPGSITEQVRTSIQQARLCIAVVSGKNPNVLYEVGIAHTLGKPTILLTEQIDEVPFDLRTIRFIVYSRSSLETARLDLEHAIRYVLGEDRLDEAERLINGGMYRAAVAILGVLLEHSLRQLDTKYTGALGSRSTRPLGLGQALRLLIESGIIRPEDTAQLRRSIDIRNRAIHGLEEPRAEDARFMLDIVQGFIERYLGSEFLDGDSGNE